MLETILFDWGNTLAEWTWSDELMAAGHAAGLAAIGREPSAELSSRYVADVLPYAEESDYRELLRAWLAPVGDGELDRYVAAEYDAWRPAHRLAATTHALLETLRDRGLRLGLVTNAFDPPELARAELARLGVAERLDAVVFSSEVGARKPAPAIFERALELLGAEPATTLMVGDRLVEDVGGAAALGMRTCQALWFRAEEDDDAPRPDFRAFTQMDVLTALRRLG
ncbi:MAG TPA: HAD family hydrolase [Gaiellaceae bacterium]|nr:HAD family hydrolase [Gaiellaceae bacterium]